MVLKKKLLTKFKEDFGVSMDEYLDHGSGQEKVVEEVQVTIEEMREEAESDRKIVEKILSMDQGQEVEVG
jgi:hypothetical protein